MISIRLPNGCASNLATCLVTSKAHSVAKALHNLCVLKREEFEKHTLSVKFSVKHSYFIIKRPLEKACNKIPERAFSNLMVYVPTDCRL